jgi:hypothetical protein
VTVYVVLLTTSKRFLVSEVGRPNGWGRRTGAHASCR